MPGLHEGTNLASMYCVTTLQGQQIQSSYFEACFLDVLVNSDEVL